MKKKSKLRSFQLGKSGRGIWKVMRLQLLLLFVGILQTYAMPAWSQQKVTITFKDVGIIEVIKEVERQSGQTVIYNNDILNRLEKVSVRQVNALPVNALNEALNRTGLKCIVVDDLLVITGSLKPVRPQPEEQQAFRVIKGVVQTAPGVTLPGATVVLKGTTVGGATDENGHFSFSIPPSVRNPVLLVSFVGMQTKEVAFKGEEMLTITLEAGVDMEEVVVTGLYEAHKGTFTGSSKTISVDEIKMVSNTNLLQALSMLTPGLKLNENNNMGANPNTLPEIILRGNSSLTSDSEVSPNQPLLILDGVEISLRDLYDININEIERVDVLKDASATALYGERAANGVIVIMRQRILHSKPRFTYNLDGLIEVADLRSYNYLNASDKLEFEKLAGLYDFEKKYDWEEYNRKQLLVSQGVNTDWMAKPLRTGMTLGNAVGISGRGGDITYRANLNMRNMKGVMKSDYRNSYGVNMYLSYNLDQKLTVSYQSSYSLTKSQNTPYGSFSSYVGANPYDLPYDADGRLVPTLSWHDQGSHNRYNPLYEATCGNYSKGEEVSFVNSLSLRWDILRNLYLTAKGSITKRDAKTEDFTSPTSAEYMEETDLNKKGALTQNHSSGLSYEGNFVMNYNQRIGEHYLATFHAGGELAKADSKSDAYTVTGFAKSGLHSPGFAAQYAEDRKATGSQSITTRVGIFANLNFVAFEKYFIDASIRRSGSSTFGANNRFAPFWAVGGGWNIHNESFIKTDWLNILRLRYSYGVTGNVSFSPYQAITTYRYNSSLFYLHGMGTIPQKMGNPDLTWQATKTHNIGLNAELFNNRLSVTFDYYIKNTDDLLIDLTIPPSVGETSVKRNLGKTQNKGFEIDVAAVLFQNDDWRVNLRFNATHNKNKILKISNALKASNDEANQDEGAAPRLMYEEGQSLTAIYGVRSAGINPATGKEIFIAKNGEYTMDYNVDDKVVLGDLEPRLEGTLFPSVYFKGWSLNVAMTYKLGGQIYNSTRAANVENVDARYNVDKRAYSLRWKNANDIVEYIDISNVTGRSAFRHTSRFVEDENTLEIRSIDIGYEFQASWMKKVRLERLRLKLGVTNPCRLSTVKYERGTEYPFSRGFSFTISPTF